MTRTSRATILVLALAAPVRAGDDARDAKPDTRSRAEILADAKEQFARRDADRDGALEAAEVPAGWLERFDLDGDGRIRESELLEVSVRPPKLRRASPMRDVAARIRFDLASFDKDKDGVVARAEFPGDQAKFREFDRDRSGALEAAELRAMAEAEIADIRRKMKSPNRYEFLVLFDSDRDNRVDLDEYDGPMSEFRKHDKDGDGVVTYDELYPEKMAERMRKGEDAASKPAELSVLDAMDADKDGKVSRAEFKGNEDAWRRLDRNGDGWITNLDAR